MVIGLKEIKVVIDLKEAIDKCWQMFVIGGVGCLLKLVCLEVEI